MWRQEEAGVKIKKGDTVEVISGRDRGLRAEVLRVLPTGGKVVVQGANVRKKHQRQVQAAGRTMSPGIIQFEAPLDVSKVMLVCPKCGDPARVLIRRDEEGKAQRVCKRCESVIDL
jgi:large subunit ribosomal protein L24